MSQNSVKAIAMMVSYNVVHTTLVLSTVTKAILTLENARSSMFTCV